jgi:transglutaminase-like putative cysteine protease
MGYRLSWLAGASAIVFTLARAHDRLLRSSVEGLPWELVLLAAAILGAALTWGGLAYRLRTATVVVLNLVAMVLVTVRIVVPQTTWFVFPTGSSFGELRVELEYARAVIRTGVAPVIPLAGIVAILAILYWVLGFLLSWGLLRGRPYVAVLAPLVVYLQFATMDRRPSGAWTFAFLVIVGLSLLAVAYDKRREGTGMLTSGVTHLALTRSLPSLAMVTLIATLFVAVLSTNALAGLVPRSGVLAWRAQSGLGGEYYGSVSYNPFVGIRQGLVAQSNVPIFVAEVETSDGLGTESGVALDELYWRLLTLDTFSGEQWTAADPEIVENDDIEYFEDPGQTFRGPSKTVAQHITVLALQQEWLPSVYATRDLSAPNTAVDKGYRVKIDDGSLRFDALTYRGMTYSVLSEIPQPDLDILSRRADGSLSSAFGGAVEDGEYEAPAAADPPVLTELEDAERYLALPEDDDLTEVATLAAEQVEGLETDFEKGLALEAFFTTPGNFRYTTNIDPGHTATDLSAWLLDDDSVNYRFGYCEQFSTAMAVMARHIGIPSRVVLGFTPGNLLDDGRVVVRARNAHAWVELWMPAQGWIRFDPTPRGDYVVPTLDGIPFDIAEYLAIPEQETPDFDINEPEIVPPFRDEPLPDIPRFPGFGSEEVATPGGISIPGWIPLTALAAAVFFGLIPAVKAMRRRRRLQRLSTGDISAAWEEIVDRLSDLGQHAPRSATAAEIATSTDRALVPLADAYGESVYGPEPGYDQGRVATARRSLEETEERLSTRYSVPQRVVARYRLRSLTPLWWRRWRRRRAERRSRS